MRQELHIWVKRKAQASSGPSCILTYSEGAAQSATDRFTKSYRYSRLLPAGRVAVWRLCP